ncbi:hypothetical protein BDV36DRAFT_308718 [Aspergillus pseudocaelatus]|uniref:Rhodopsin domain-containing protein n=1 Tax=Aspergillus pseudocaelatus TaxID=1825620 RepID=A0ABQ6WMU1_9EURO|nr:hypothetical protein BDV36DRAFT_308718 [Aspergillus pseudocaelatus]
MSTQKGILPPPPGVEPNFINPRNQFQGCIPFITFYLTFNSMALVMRVYTRRVIIRASLAIDDSTVVPWESDVTSGISHVAQLQRSRNFISYILCLAFSKLTILCFYYRLFSSRASLKVLIIIGIVFEASGTLALVAVAHYTFTPFEKFGDPAVKPNIPRIVPIFFSGLLAMTTDIYVLVLPIPSVLRLKVPLLQKLKALAIIVLGASACTASIIRVVHTAKMKDPNVLWNVKFVGGVGYWASAVECDHALLCSCLLVLPVFIQHHWPKMRSLFGRLRGKKGDSSVEGSPLPRTRSWPAQDQWNVNKLVDIYIFEEIRHLENLPKTHIAIHPNRQLSSADIEQGEQCEYR